jgi:hypothetical protein
LITHIFRPPLRKARLIGAEARRLLAPGFCGEVLAALSDTIYLSGKDGEILWMAGEGSPPHWRCILSSASLRAICRGQGFSFDPPYLRFDGSFWMDVSSGMEWKPPIIGPERARTLPNIEATLRSLLGVLQLLEIPDGLGPSIFLVSGLMEGRHPPAYSADSLMARAKDTALDLARGCLQQDLLRCALGGRQLAGLGPGLTPSGDDFLGALFFAARSLHQAYPEDFPWAEDAVGELLDWTKTRTHPISYAVFRDLVFGYGPAALHDFFTRILEGNDPNPVLNAAIRLTRIGHSSGWDMLAGALTGLLMVKKSIEHSAAAPQPKVPRVPKVS